MNAAHSLDYKSNHHLRNLVFGRTAEDRDELLNDITFEELD